MAAYRRVYDSRHLQADCQEQGSAPETYARQSSMGHLLPRWKPFKRRAELRAQKRGLPKYFEEFHSQTPPNKNKRGGFACKFFANVPRYF